MACSRSCGSRLCGACIPQSRPGCLRPGSSRGPHSPRMEHPTPSMRVAVEGRPQPFCWGFWFVDAKRVRAAGSQSLSRLGGPKVSAHMPSPATCWPPGPLMRASEPGSSEPTPKRGRTATHEPCQPWASVWTEGAHSLCQSLHRWGTRCSQCSRTFHLSSYLWVPALGGRPSPGGQQHTNGQAIRRGKSLPQPVPAGRPETPGTGCCLESHPSHGWRTGTQPGLSVVPPTAGDPVLLLNGHSENLRPATPPRGREGSRDSLSTQLRQTERGYDPVRAPAWFLQTSRVPPVRQMGWGDLQGTQGVPGGYSLWV